ncbi:MAG: pilus assembly protein TadG-related protein [Actinobacteria bacterium]|nr:pilus assembly protein TadG-related protein [Actinomycetota bacterium]
MGAGTIDLFKMDERGQSYPIVAISIFIIFALLTATVGLGWLALRRSEMQAAADAAALAGANALAKTEMTVATFELAQFTVHLAADFLIAVGGLASYVGVGAPLLESGIELKSYAKTKLDPALNDAKDAANMLGPIYAVSNSVTYASANGYSGIGIPWPVEGLGRRSPTKSIYKDDSDYSDKMQELAKKLEEYERRIREADAKMAELKSAYPRNYLEVDADGDGKSDFEEAAGSKGGCTTMKRKIEKEMQELAKNQRKARDEEKKKLLSKIPKITAGKDGIIVVVWKKSERIPYLGLFGNHETGFNLAFSAAKTESGRRTIGGSAIEELSRKSPIFGGMATGVFGGYLDAVGWLYKTKSSFGGVLGMSVSKALDLLGIDPPNIFEKRVVLTSAKEVLASEVGFARRFSEIVEFVKGRVSALSAERREALPSSGRVP